MRQRWIRLALLTWLSVWFGVIVPGHQVGAIRVAGAAAQAASESRPTSPLAIMGAAGCCTRSGDSSGKNPGLPNRNSCAVCQLIAKLDTPVMAPLTAPPLGLAELLPWPTVTAAIVLQVIPVHSGRDPPALSHA